MHSIKAAKSDCYAYDVPAFAEHNGRDGRNNIITYIFTRRMGSRIRTKERVLVHGQVTIIFVVFVCLFVCLFVCAEFFSAVFDPISIKLGNLLYVWL